MTAPFHEDDPVLDALKALPVHDVSAGRAAEIRRRCEARLARRTGRAAPTHPARMRPWQQVLEPAMVAGISALYLYEVVRRAFMLQGF